MLEQIFPRLKLTTTYRAGEELLVSANGGKAKVQIVSDSVLGVEIFDSDLLNFFCGHWQFESEK
jgi:hypothetical protein